MEESKRKVGNDGRNNGNGDGGYGYGVGLGDVATVNLLGRTGYGTGYGGGYGGHGPFATPSANGARIQENTNLLNRNNEDDHFNDLNRQIQNLALANQQQMSQFALANQQQISQLALQMCECCGDQKAALGKIEGQLECLQNNLTTEINLCVTQQTNQDLLGQIAVAQNAANSNAQQQQHAQILAALAQLAGDNVGIEPDFARALAGVQTGAATVLVTGSFHTVGDAMNRLPGFAPLG